MWFIFSNFQQSRLEKQPVEKYLLENGLIGAIRSDDVKGLGIGLREPDGIIRLLKFMLSLQRAHLESNFQAVESWVGWCACSAPAATLCGSILLDLT